MLRACIECCNVTDVTENRNIGAKQQNRIIASCAHSIELLCVRCNCIELSIIFLSLAFCRRPVD